MTRAVRARWDDERTAAIAAGLRADLARRKSSPKAPFEPPASPFGRTPEGLVDYRGLRLTEPIRHARVAGVDFTAVALGGGGQLDSDFTSCVFDQAVLRGTYVGRSFTRCSFRRAGLDRCRLPASFTDCSFAGARLRGVVASGRTFTRCDFTGADLHGSHFDHCAFVDCRFADLTTGFASLAGSTFAGEVDLTVFTDTVLDHVTVSEPHPATPPRP
ncbi:pentapeptide repeat-containing protein [Actinosynnema sp. NPDC023587]|uniref:pentapeptide repeat-containing protein n=1 Tax=Actinosynnema sp. NPDC023587 TaxID=3154695 RepID=UPI003400475B